MNAAHLHLLVNHIPFYLLIIGMIALVVSMKRKSSDLRVLASSLFILAGLFAWFAFPSGEGAEDILEAMGGYSHELIEQHEEAAIWARRSGTWVAILALMMEWAIRKKKKFAKALQWALLVFGLHGLTVYLATSYLGGQISHPELRPTEQVQSDL